MALPPWSAAKVRISYPSRCSAVSGSNSSISTSKGTRSTPSPSAAPRSLRAPFGPKKRIGSVRPWSPSVRTKPITPRKWSAWKCVKNTSESPKETP